jgi:hypothetical protein
MESNRERESHRTVLSIDMTQTTTVARCPIGVSSATVVLLLTSLVLTFSSTLPL